jgi:hypothetical protein
MKKLNVLMSLFFIIVAGGLFWSPETKVSGQQDRGWKVWVKTSPCSGRHDWVSVAKENPTYGGGGGIWSNADLIVTGTGMFCVSNSSQSCSFAAATAEAAIVRASDRFSTYCCREYSVWQHRPTGKRTVVVGKFGTAGFGWDPVAGPMCCAEAEALAGIPGACSGSQGGGTGWGPTDHQSSLQGETLTYYGGTTPEKCQIDCGGNPKCKAFTFIRAGAYNPNDPPMCYLISKVSGSSKHSCCISAVKSEGGGDRPTTEVDLSGAWQASITESNTGYSFRYDLMLSRISAGQWKGPFSLTVSQNPSLGFNSEATLENLGGGNMRITYFAKGRMQQGSGTFNNNAILFGGSQNSVRFTRR